MKMLAKTVGRSTITQSRLRTIRCQQYNRGFASSVGNYESRDSSSDLYNYTSGRWLYDEQFQLRRRYREFNVKALKEYAYREFGTPCVEMSKLPEGQYNKVFSLKMQDRREVLARIPNPNAGQSSYIVSSEFATLDFLRNVLDVPVPKILAWSSQESQISSIGTQYIIMQKAQGRQLSEVWPTMSEKQRFALVKDLVAIEKRLLGIDFLAHGSIYYKTTYPDGLGAVNIDQLPTSKQETGSNFVIGPTTERSFFIENTRGKKIDQGPWRTAQEYLSAVTRREILRIQSPEAEKPSGISGRISTRRARAKNHVLLLEQFVTILPYIVPTTDIARPTLMHHDLHLDNIFVNDTDPTKISSIIDWQAVFASPRFLQARYPSIVDCDDPYPWGAVQPSLPEGFDALSSTEQAISRDALRRLRLKKFYEIASRKFNPTLFTAMDATRNHSDPTSFIFHVIGQSASYGPVPLEELLIQVYGQWDKIALKNGLDIPCPFSFNEDEINEKRQRAQEWANVFREFETLQTRIAGKDGWVSHEEYEEGIHIF